METGALADLSPADLSLPAAFSGWRPIQRDAIEQVVYSSRRFQALAMPTGSGKSLTAMGISRITGYRTVIVTGTKGLMDQYLREFGADPVAAQVIYKLTSCFRRPHPDELVDIRGKGNYQCQEHKHVGCDDGQKMACKHWQTEGCAYGFANAQSRRSQVVVTNYKYWLTIHAAGRGLSPEHLVLDEAHLAPEELAGFLGFHITQRELEDLGIRYEDTDDIAAWKFCARSCTADLRADVLGHTLHAAKRTNYGRAELDHLKHLESLLERMERLKRVRTDDGYSWVCQEEKGRRGKQWNFDPIWPGAFSESALFQGVPHVTLISATLRPKTLHLLGVPKDQYDFREWQRIFPVSRSPVIHIPTVRMNYKIGDEGLKVWTDRIDEIIESRLDRKGVIHTVSYARQQHLMSHSRFAHLFIGNTSDINSETATQAVLRFKASSAPSILVSPSFSTGWDFPGDECEWCIIAKIPFPPSQSKVMKARVAKDPQYLSYLAMQDLVQSAGRGMRSETDRCETFIVDDTVTWFLWHNRTLAPKWFQVRKCVQIPSAPLSLFEEEMKRKQPGGSGGINSPEIGIGDFPVGVSQLI